MSGESNRLTREGSGFLRFCVVGAFGLIVDAGALLVLIQHVGLDPYLARVLSIAFAISVTWAAHRLWTFGTLGHARLAEWARYHLTSMFGAVVNFTVYGVLIAFVEGTTPLWAMAFSSIVALVVNFLGARFFAFSATTLRPT